MITVALSDFNPSSDKSFPETVSGRVNPGAFVPRAIIVEGVWAIIVGRLEGWKVGKLESWKVGKLESWKVEKLKS
jgi:hypothetical protein